MLNGPGIRMSPARKEVKESGRNEDADDHSTPRPPNDRVEWFSGDCI